MIAPPPARAFSPAIAGTLRPCRVYQYDINGQHAWFGTGPNGDDITGIHVAEFGETAAEVRHRLREVVRVAGHPIAIVR